MNHSEMFLALNDRLDKIEQRLDEISLLTRETLTFDQAYRYLNISASQLYKLRHAGAIAAYKPGGKLLFFKRTDLDAWMMSRRIKTSKELRSEALSKLDRNQKM